MIDESELSSEFFFMSRYENAEKGRNPNIVKVTVSFDLSLIGNVFQQDGKLHFPVVPEEPGIYQFAIRDKIYVGETDRLRRRFQHYRTPGSSQPTNVRINKSILDALEEGFDIVVSTIEQATINVDGIDSPLDLSIKSGRLLVESAVLSSARLSGQLIENL